MLSPHVSGSGRLLTSSRARVALPLCAMAAGAAVGCANLALVEPFVIFRACVESAGCPLSPVEQGREDYRQAGIFLSAVLVMFHLPSALCYLGIYCFVRRKQVR